jgi:hypothetical protein
MRKWSLLWVSVWLGCGATALCMMKPLETWNGARVVAVYS